MRQWVLSLPFTLRSPLAFDAQLTAAGLALVIRWVFAGRHRAAARQGFSDGSLLLRPPASAGSAIFSRARAGRPPLSLFPGPPVWDHVPGRSPLREHQQVWWLEIAAAAAARLEPLAASIISPARSAASAARGRLPRGAGRPPSRGGTRAPTPTPRPITKPVISRAPAARAPRHRRSTGAQLMALVRSPPCYERHRPEDTVLYRTLERHLEPFLARASDQGGGDGLPTFVTRELRAYLRCGRLEHGCVHVRCEPCGDDMVVAFSCKGRGFCPSCGARRMSERAAHLVDRVIPRVPVRQWVLSLPFTLRYQLAFDATLTAAVLDVFIRCVFAGLQRTAAREGIADAQGGAITAIQRFGSALNVNVHFHALVLDGVFSRSAPGAAPVFHPLPAPTDEEIVQILEHIHERVTRLLRRCGRLPEDPSPTDPVAEQMPLLAGYAAASIQELIATGPRAGHPVRRLRTAAAVVDGEKLRCARLQEFSLHANVALPAHAREPLEHLCRYLLRPPLATERLTESSGGQLLYELPHARRDGSTHLLLDPLELIEKLSVLIPPPRFHLLRFHGVLAPRAQLRAAVVPRPSGDVELGGGQAPSPSPAEPRSRPSSGAGRLSWAALMRRVFAVDVLLCPRCGGRRRIVAVYPAGPRLRDLLDRLGLSQPPGLPPPQGGPAFATAP